MAQTEDEAQTEGVVYFAWFNIIIFTFSIAIDVSSCSLHGLEASTPTQWGLNTNAGEASALSPGSIKHEELNYSLSVCVSFCLSRLFL